MGRAPGSRAHPLPVPVAGSSLLACSGASVSIVHFKSDPGMSKARCLLASSVSLLRALPLAKPGRSWAPPLKRGRFQKMRGWCAWLGHLSRGESGGNG